MDKYCSKCGESINPKAKFCESCGHVQDQQIIASAPQGFVPSRKVEQIKPTGPKPSLIEAVRVMFLQPEKSGIYFQYGKASPSFLILMIPILTISIIYRTVLWMKTDYIFPNPEEELPKNVFLINSSILTLGSIVTQWILSSLLLGVVVKYSFDRGSYGYEKPFELMFRVNTVRLVIHAIIMLPRMLILLLFENFQVAVILSPTPSDEVLRDFPFEFYLLDFSLQIFAFVISAIFIYRLFVQGLKVSKSLGYFLMAATLLPVPSIIIALLQYS